VSNSKIEKWVNEVNAKTTKNYYSILYFKNFSPGVGSCFGIHLIHPLFHFTNRRGRRESYVAYRDLARELIGFIGN